MAILALALLGCAARHPIAPAPPSASAQPRTAAQFLAALRLAPTGPDVAGYAATRATERYLRVFVAAVAHPEQGPPPQLTDVATGPAVTALTDQLDFMRQNKLAARGDSLGTLRFLGTRDGAAFVMNCAPNGQIVVYHADTGRLAENIDPGYAVSFFELRGGDPAGWKVFHTKAFSEPRCP